MGLFDEFVGGIFGNSGKTSSTKTGTTKGTSTQTGTSKTTGTSTQTGVQTGSQTQTSTQAQTGTVSLLDDETIGMLKGLLPTLIGSVKTGAQGAGQDINSIVNFLTQRGLSGGNIEGEIAARKAEAERKFNLDQGSAIAGTEQLIGSRGNTFSALLRQQGALDLNTMLAAIDADARAQARGQSLADLGTAISGIGTNVQASLAAGAAPIQNLAAIIGLLHGAKQTTEGQTVGSAAGTSTDTSNIQTTTVEDLIRSLIENTTETAAFKDSTNTKSGGLLGGLASIFG